MDDRSAERAEARASSSAPENKAALDSADLDAAIELLQPPETQFSDSQRLLIEGCTQLIAGHGLSWTMSQLQEVTRKSRGFLSVSFTGQAALTAVTAREVLRLPVPDQVFGLAQLLRGVEAAPRIGLGPSAKERAKHLLLGAGYIYDDLRPLVRASHQISLEGIERHLNAAKAAGEIREDIDTRAHAVWILGAIRGIVIMALSGVPDIDLELTARALVDAVRAAVSPT